MADYISRQAAIRIVCDDECEDCPDGGCDMYRRLKRLPAADVRPVVRGKWIVDSIASNIFTCSVCGQDAPVEPTGGTEYKSNFCPGCGADMRKVKTDEK